MRCGNAHGAPRDMLDVTKLQELLEGGETLSVEFKSDRNQISDSTIYEEVVALANTDGGVILLGVENDGTVTGARARHGAVTEPLKLQAAIFNNTRPNINTRVTVIPTQNGEVLCLETDRYPEICATAGGKCLRRVIGPDGRPQTVPFYPQDHTGRRSDLGLLDFSAQTMPGLSISDFDPLEIERLRQTIARLEGDRRLLDLPDEEFVKALRLVETTGKETVPTIAGILLLARPSALERVVPTHEVFFQVLDAQDNVRVNDCFHAPLLRTLVEVESRFAARNEQREVNVGLFRVPIPDYVPESFREALSNAVLHRDYSRQGAVYVQWRPDHIRIVNPGGFPDGVTVNNILVHEPKPRNPRLAEAFRRIGLIEQTGRGVDRIYHGQLRYGRPAPDYGQTDAANVRVILYGGEPSLEFSGFVFEQERNSRPLTLDELLLLNELFRHREIDMATAGSLIQKGAGAAHAALQQLVERGIVEARGQTRNRTYQLSASVYRRLRRESEYIRGKGFDPIQQEQMVRVYVEEFGPIKRAKVMELCRIGPEQAKLLLRKMVHKYLDFKMLGNRRGARYVIERQSNGPDMGSTHNPG